MSTLQTIKTKQLEARKGGLASDASILTTLIGEAEMIGKNAQREVTEEEVLKLIKKFADGVYETILILQDRGIPQDDLIGYFTELDIYNEFLPEAPSDDEVELEILELMTREQLEPQMKSMGRVSGVLKSKYGAAYNGKQVSRIFKEKIIE